jgi:hypothetical protein
MAESTSPALPRLSPLNHVSIILINRRSRYILVNDDKKVNIKRISLFSLN